MKNPLHRQSSLCILLMPKKCNFAGLHLEKELTLLKIEFIIKLSGGVTFQVQIFPLWTSGSSHVQPPVKRNKDKMCSKHEKWQRKWGLTDMYMNLQLNPSLSPNWNLFKICLCKQCDYMCTHACVCVCAHVREREREITYFQPTICPQKQQNMSATVCCPETIILSSNAPTLMFTLEINTKTKTVCI